MKTCSIGIFAHVDAGKTTLSEQLLLKAGSIRTPGSVDRGTAHTDRTEIERRRGISVHAACAPLIYGNTRINLIDTPGHADFFAEVERSMWALDIAVLLLSAVDGVQPQAEVLFSYLAEHRIPTVIFINKSDRAGADPEGVAADAREILSSRITLTDDESMMAMIAEDDEQALEDYLSGTIYPHDRLCSMMIERTRCAQIVPVLSGSALTGAGVDELLELITDIAQNEDPSEGGPAGIVFALDDDPVMGRGAYVRLFSGSLHNRNALTLSVTHENAYTTASGTEERKITQIRDISVDGRGQDMGELNAGQIGIVYGLGNVSVGQIIGDPSLLPRQITAGQLKEPLLMVRVLINDPKRRPDLLKALSVLSAEDPLLDVKMYLGEPHIRVMGAIQLEILTETLRTRFGLETEFTEPEVIYRETIRREATGFCAYTMPKPCWAVIQFLIRPAPRGSGISYRSVVPVRQIKARYQHQIEQGLMIALRQGMLGWAVDDVDIVLIDGNDHQFHTHPLDFIVATPMAFMDGLRSGGSVLLEPILKMRIGVPSEAAGKVLSEITAMHGETTHTEVIEARDSMILTAEVPVRTSVAFPTRLAAITGGRGTLSMHVTRYSECPELHTCPRAGVHPLDTAKYILAARSALDGSIF